MAQPLVDPLNYSLGIQLWTLREDWEKNPLETLRRLAAMGLQGIEVYGQIPLPAAALKAALDDLGMRVAAAHVGPDLGIDLNQRMADARVLGHDHFIWSLPADPFATDAGAMALAQEVNARRGALASEGFRMSLHNHEWEFASPERGHAFLAACDKVGLEFDLYWLKTAGLDPAAMVSRYASRLSLLHAKDGPARRGLPMTALGQGVVDVKAALAAAALAKAPLEWVLLELDACATDVWEALRESKAYLDN